MFLIPSSRFRNQSPRFDKLTDCFLDHQGPKSLVGAAIKNGYSSHFIVTNGKGSALDHVQNDEIYDEMVPTSLPTQHHIPPWCTARFGTPLPRESRDQPIFFCLFSVSLAPWSSIPLATDFFVFLLLWFKS